MWFGTSQRVVEALAGDSTQRPHAARPIPCLPAGRGPVTRMEGSRTRAEPWQQHWTAPLRARSRTRPQRCSGRGASPRPSASESSPRPPPNPPGGAQAFQSQTRGETQSTHSTDVKWLISEINYITGFPILPPKLGKSFLKYFLDFRYNYFRIIPFRIWFWCTFPPVFCSIWVET